jgi:hypothetical protein
VFLLKMCGRKFNTVDYKSYDELNLQLRQTHSSSIATDHPAFPTLGNDCAASGFNVNT